MVNKKIVYGLVILSLLRAFSLDAAAHYTPPAGFEGLAQELTYQEIAEINDKIQSIDIKLRNIEYDLQNIFPNNLDIKFVQMDIQDIDFVIRDINTIKANREKSRYYADFIATGEARARNLRSQLQAFQQKAAEASFSEAKRKAAPPSLTPLPSHMSPELLQFQEKLLNLYQPSEDMCLGSVTTKGSVGGIGIEGELACMIAGYKNVSWLLPGTTTTPELEKLRQAYNIQEIEYTSPPPRAFSHRYWYTPKGKHYAELLRQYGKEGDEARKDKKPRLNNDYLVGLLLGYPEDNILAYYRYLRNNIPTPPTPEAVFEQDKKEALQWLKEHGTRLHEPSSSEHKEMISTVAAQAALQEHKAKAEAEQEIQGQTPVSTITSKPQPEIKAGAAIPARSAPVSTATSATTTAPTPSIEEQGKITEQERIVTQQLADEINDIEKQLYRMEDEQWQYSEETLKAIMSLPIKERIPELTKSQGDVAASIQTINNIIMRLDTILYDPAKLKRTAQKIMDLDAFKEKAKSIQSKLKTVQQKVATGLTATKAPVLKTVKASTPTAAPKPQVPVKASVPPKAGVPPKSSALPTPPRPALRQIMRPATELTRPASTRVTPPAQSAPATRAAVPSRAPAQARASLPRSSARQVAPAQPKPLPSRPSAAPTPPRAAPRQITRPTVAQPAQRPAPTRTTPLASVQQAPTRATTARPSAPVTRAAVPSRAPAQARPPLSRPAATPIPRSASIRVTPPARPAATRPSTVTTPIRRPVTAPAVPSSRPTPRLTQPAPRPIPTPAIPAARSAAVTRPTATPPRSTAVMRQQAAREKERLAAQAKAAARTQSTKPGYRR